MPFTQAQIAAAEAQQVAAAQDPAGKVRLVAGPGTGKTKSIERRVAHVLSSGVPANEIFAISFTRATCAELSQRIIEHCTNLPIAAAAASVHVSTMHSLALGILRRAQLLTSMYPSEPVVLDEWEHTEIYDAELAVGLGCAPGRAAEIRRAYDAEWQTLAPSAIAQAKVTPAEQAGFNSFHASRRNLYCCVLPGELIHSCVVGLRSNQIQQRHLPRIAHLIVDEFQDLNLCDQEFIELLTQAGTVLFVAGDDDQSIYASLRHADPSGLVNFPSRYPGTTTHILSECFRCAPAVLDPARRLIAVNPARITKVQNALLGAASPPVQGHCMAWSFQSQQAEAEAIAESCRELVAQGMAGHESRIIILISDRGIQLDSITSALANQGLPFETPRSDRIADDQSIRVGYCIARVALDCAGVRSDYVSYRALLKQKHGVGPATAREIGELCIQNRQNFRDVFVQPVAPSWLAGRNATAVGAIRALVQSTSGWTATDTLATRIPEILGLAGTHVLAGSQALPQLAPAWQALQASLPSDMSLAELVAYLGAYDGREQDQVLAAVHARLGTAPATNPSQPRIRILTMHGAKGLSGAVVFIPTAAQEVMPSRRAIKSAGLLIEQRRLFYVSLTRAQAACIVTHPVNVSGPTAFRLANRPTATLTRSQFLNEMNVRSVTRVGGLSSAEAASICADVANLPT